MKAYFSKMGVLFTGYAPQEAECIELSTEQYDAYTEFYPYAKPVYSDGQLVTFVDAKSEFLPPTPTDDEQRDLFLAQLYENQLLMLNGMSDLVVI